MVAGVWSKAPGKTEAVRQLYGPKGAHGGWLCSRLMNQEVDEALACC